MCMYDIGYDTDDDIDDVDGDEDVEDMDDDIDLLIHYTAHGHILTIMADEQMKTDLYRTIHQLFTNDAQLVTMRGNVEQLAQPDSAGRVATELIKLAGERQS